MALSNIRLNFKVFAVLSLLLLGKAHAQQVDFKASVANIDSLISYQYFDSAKQEIYALKTSIQNTSVEKQDSVQLYFTSKLAYINYKLENCDSAIVQGQREHQLRTDLFGLDDPETITAQHNLGVFLINCGELERAKGILLEALSLHQQHLRRVDNVMLTTMDDLAYCYGRLDQVDSANLYYRELISLLIEYTSKGQFYHHVIDNYSALLMSKGLLEEAAVYYEDLKDYKKQAVDYPSFLKDYYNAFIQIPDYVKALETAELLLDLCQEEGRCAELEYSQAEFLLNAARLNVLLVRHEEAMEAYDLAFEQYDGEPQVQINILLEHAEIANSRQQKSEQFEKLQMARDMHRAHDLTDSSSYAQTVFKLGALYTELGEFQSADQIFQEYISDLESTADQNPTKLAQAYQSLGNQRYLMRNFKDADEYFGRAEKILVSNELTAGREFASLLNSRGALYEALANYDAAEENYLSALHLVADASGTQGLQIALASNLANVLLTTRPNSDSVEVMLNQAIEWQQDYTGRKHPAFSNLLGKRAQYYRINQSYELAEKDYLEAIATLEYTVGKSHPEYLNLNSNLGLLYDETDRNEQALELMSQSKAQYESLYTEDHPGYLLTLNNLANLYTKMERFEEAEALLLKLADLQVKQIELSFSYLSENEKEKFMDEKRKFLDNFKRYIIARGNQDIGSLSPEVLTKWYDLELATKGMLLNSTKRVRDQIFQSGNAELIELFSEWTLVRKQIADMKSITAAQANESDALIDSLSSQIVRIEKVLTRKSEEFSSSFASQSVTFSEIRNALPEASAAVELVKVELDSGSVYASLIILKNKDYPQLVFLGDGEKLEEEGYKVYKNSVRYQIQDMKSFNTFWRPVHSLLQQYELTQIFYAPDGVYHRINLGTLYNPDAKEYLLEEYQIVQLSSTKELHNKRAFEEHAADEFDFLLVGRPSYSSAGQVETSQMNTRSFSIGHISDLPGTEEEVSTIADLLTKKSVSYELWLHDQSSESRLKENLNHQVVHIATHGFFLDESNTNSSGPQLDPMLYSGLLFAGVSDRDVKAKTGQDGILTAYEIMNLNLSKNKMVILSACETGLGEISAGEGIYGLQRAFFVAGTETIIMSLWKVNDAATKDLMINFYKGYLKSGNKREAFADAQKKLMKQYKEPIYWGAFVMLGM